VCFVWWVMRDWCVLWSSGQVCFVCWVMRDWCVLWNSGQVCFVCWILSLSVLSIRSTHGHCSTTHSYTTRYAATTPSLLLIMSLEFFIDITLPAALWPWGRLKTLTGNSKLKWSRYRPGVAQRVGSGIALLFHDRGTRRGWVVSSKLRPHFTSGKDPVPILQEAGWAPGSVWTGGKISSPPGFDLRTVQPVAQPLYRLSYPAHTLILLFYKKKSTF